VTDTPRETCVLNAVVPLVDSLFDDFDMAEMLTDLTERCTALLDVAAGGLLLADPRSQLHLMVATSERSRELELFELQAGTTSAKGNALHRVGVTRPSAGVCSRRRLCRSVNYAHL
jgi:hypothetical protein